MARRKDKDKKAAIRAAAVAEVIEAGLGGASVARIARRAGVSAGTIYLYFENKEQMLQQIYLQIKTDFHRQMMDAAAERNGCAEKIRAMWFSLFEQLTRSPNDFVFAEYVSAAQLLDDERRDEVAAMSADVDRILKTAMTRGVLQSAPIDVVRALLVAPAVQLARRQAAGGRPLTRATLEKTFAMIWRGLSA